MIDTNYWRVCHGFFIPSLPWQVQDSHIRSFHPVMPVDPGLNIMIIANADVGTTGIG